jgi:hypothetical protein
MLEVDMAVIGNHFSPQKPGAFDCGLDGLCGGGAWGSSQLENHFKEPN